MSAVSRGLWRGLAAFTDPTIVLSFDRRGFAIHRHAFRPGDLPADLRGRVVVVTGASSGLGLAAARALAELGAELILACRSRDKGEAAAAEVPRSRLELVDLADLASVRALAARLPRVDVLVHNAGLLPAARTLSPQGLELTVATHLAGPHLLTRLVAPRLTRGARILFVSSGGMYPRRLSVARLEALSASTGPYDGVNAYADTKRAQVVLAALWADRLRASGVDVHAMHPGWADTPAVHTSLPKFHQRMQRLLRTPDEGADTIVWLAACARLAGDSGHFWFDRRRARKHFVPWTIERAAERASLWAFCERVTENVTPLTPPTL
jgi:NAD(P)-dependent dehydrogenase (short-subunit alcohol dehydrogenase family)